MVHAAFQVVLAPHQPLPLPPQVKEFRQLFQAGLAVFNKLRGTQNDGAALAAFVEATAEEIISGSYGPEETHFAAQMSRHYHAGGLSKEKLQAEVGILQLARK